jgi:hypothetical protein
MQYLQNLQKLYNIGEIIMAKEYVPKCSTLYKLSLFIDKYGANATLKDVFEQHQGPYKYKCPKCNGRGYIKRMYNGYDGELPDSRGFNFVFEEAYKDVECDVCNGIGYTREEMVPNYVQDGWKVKQ